MRDGRLIQVGTPEEIVMQPVDDYVADFVAGISRLKVVRAHAIMQPLPQGSQASLPESAPTFGPEDNLSDLITASIEYDGKLRVVDKTGCTIGSISRSNILKTVIEGTETS